MVEVFINGERLQLNSEIVQTFQLNSIADIESRQTSYTNKFKIPKTPKNVLICNYLDITGKKYNNNINSGQFPYDLPKVQLIENGIEILSNGYASIIDSIPGYYNMVIYGAEKSFYEKLKGVTLQDTFPDLNFDFTKANINANISNNNIFTFEYSGYHADMTAEIYDWNDIQNGAVPEVYIEVKKMTPLFFVKDLFENIFAYAGYSLDYNLLSELNFTELLMSAQKGVELLEIPYGSTFNLRILVSQMLAVDFIKEIMYRFGLLMRVDEINKVVTFKNIDEILNSEPLDFSNKFDSKIKEQTKGNYALENNLNYLEDILNVGESSIQEENELQGQIFVNNSNLTAKKTLVSSKFKKPLKDGILTGSAQVYYTGGMYYPVSNTLSLKLETLNIREYELIQQGQGGIGTPDKLHGIPPVLCYRKFYNLPFKYTLQVSPADPGTWTTYQKNDFYHCQYANETSSSLLNISFQTYLDTYYLLFVKLLQNYKKINVFLNLNSLDIYNLDLFKPIHIKQLGANFYINKVINYQTGKLTEVELIQIPIN